MLISVFDEQRNDYADYYSVYKAPLSARDQASVPAKDFINNHGSIGGELMGEVPVRDMLFDKTLRNEPEVVVVEKHIFEADEHSRSRVVPIDGVLRVREKF